MSTETERKALARLQNAAENLSIAIGMGWDLDGVVAQMHDALAGWRPRAARTAEDERQLAEIRVPTGGGGQPAACPISPTKQHEWEDLGQLRGKRWVAHAFTAADLPIAERAIEYAKVAVQNYGAEVARREAAERERDDARAEATMLRHCLYDADCGAILRRAEGLQAALASVKERTLGSTYGMGNDIAIIVEDALARTTGGDRALCGFGYCSGRHAECPTPDQCPGRSSAKEPI